ncbi:hypothetical protein [Pseudomonas protegens]|uniref:hypothetical protein n=1 Tax=Pseudomonas protegens TaxID=380021 RepID=UPI00069FF03D|nr:hypothetical protein [Pseudomonas protegens]ROL86516.1 hypothetical protein BK639_28350 [Pseudomonas protegens]ROL95146.1 hypothetical protein BK640_29090 [Pseudomonas protegens]ROL97865.1 hypothetical protein BK641_27015 [Pseudomonas protegens]ROM07651.1 hypothetical protein BK642_13915 [Pseudomonas protegens]
MFNMATMAADECREDKADRSYHSWLSKVEKIAGHFIELGSEEESDFGDFHREGLTPAEAVTEMLAQQELERAA